LPETDAITKPVTFEVCRIKHGELAKDIKENKKTMDKLAKIVIGNGEVGLLEKVNTLYQRNQLVDQVFNVFKAVATTLITLYLSGVLHL